MYFEQKFFLKKIIRLIIFILLSYMIINNTENKIDDNDKIKIILQLSIVFIIYEHYYPNVVVIEKNDD